MSIKSLLKGWTIPESTEETHIRKYSTTGDILAFKRCKRQYGHFSVRGFSSATATTRYFGTLVHDVLDQINRDYGNDPTLPDAAQVETLVTQAHDRLIRSGVRPYNPRQQRERAAKLIYRFVRLVGPYFFPHVEQTEYRLERALETHAKRDYVLDGIVDVLAGSVSHDLGLPFSTEPEDVEIWDYKSGHMPDKGTPEMRDYEYQMRVYAELYRQQTGTLPARCALVFVGELGDDNHWNESQPELTAFPRLIYTVHPNEIQIRTALDDFNQAVEDIEAERTKPYNEQWQAPNDRPDPQICEACELRFNCSSFPQGARQRSEPL